MSLRIKICGITNPDDARAAVEAGADALGFMFYEPSPRNVLLSVAAAIIQTLPPFVARVGVFVDAPEDLVRRAIAECGLDTLQFHGGESPEYCRQFSQFVVQASACPPGESGSRPLKTIKAFRIRDAESLEELPRYETSSWLLDSFTPDKFGGSGAKFNWELAAVAKESGRPIILAGGLTPENVGAAVGKVRPYAVDVSSGVESKPGRKDREKLRVFIAEARRAAETENARYGGPALPLG